MDLSHLASQPAESPRHSESPVAELPEGWVVKFDPRTNRRYYENRETRSTQWQHPCDVPDSVPPDYWQRATDPASGVTMARGHILSDEPTGKHYYINHHLKSTQWEVPSVAVCA